MEKIEESMRPVWPGGQICRETLTMVEENGRCAAPFLYEPKELLRLESYDGAQIYEKGRDYQIEGRMLTLTENSRIPRASWSDFYDPSEARAKERQEQLSLGFGPVETTDGRYVRLEAVGHPELVTRFQVAATYLTEEAWPGEKPASGLPLLPRFVQKTAAKEPIRLLVYGDSISCGYDCSGLYGMPPYQPIWPVLLKDSLEAFYGLKIELINTSVGGVDTDWACENAMERACRYQPDLVLLGFGMNDRCPGAEYARKTERLIQAIRGACPSTELVLLATSLPNPLLKTAPFYFCAHQEEYADALRPLCGPGVAMADIQGVQRTLMTRKRYIDLAGNLLNHPNDYLARVQAQTVAAALMPLEA